MFKGISNRTTLTVAAALVLAGCASAGPNPYGATAYSGAATQTEQQVSFGTVVSLAAAKVKEGQGENALATGIGAVAGGIAGNSAGGGEWTSVDHAGRRRNWRHRRQCGRKIRQHTPSGHHHNQDG